MARSAVRGSLCPCGAPRCSHLGGADEMYCEFDDDEHFLEFYEHGSDPWQLDNCAAKVPPAKIAGYHARLSKLRACAGHHTMVFRN